MEIKKKVIKKQKITSEVTETQSPVGVACVLRIVTETLRFNRAVKPSSHSRQNVGMCLKCIQTKFEVSTRSRFEDIAVQD